MRADVERGMLLMAAGVLMVPGVHAIAKSLGDTLSVGQIVAARYFFQFLLLLPLVWVGHEGRIPAPRIGNAVLGLLLVTASISFILAVTLMPLADSAAIFFVEPLLLTLISALFLGETIGWRRLAAITAGFAGALIVIRPSFQDLGLPALLPLVAGSCYAVYMTVARHVVQSQDGRVIQFWVSVFALAVLTVAMIIGHFADWELFRPAWPQGHEWLMLGALGAISLGSHMLAIRALKLAPAGILAPFQYLEIFGATILGVVFFADLPDAVTTAGILIIVASGLYVFHRERQLARRKTGSSVEE